MRASTSTVAKCGKGDTGGHRVTGPFWPKTDQANGLPRIRSTGGTSSRDSRRTTAHSHDLTRMAAHFRHQLDRTPNAGAALRRAVLVISGDLADPSKWQQRVRRMPDVENLAWSITTGYSQDKYGPYFGDWLPTHRPVGQPAIHLGWDTRATGRLRAHSKPLLLKTRGRVVTPNRKAAERAWSLGARPRAATGSSGREACRSSSIKRPSKTHGLTFARFARVLVSRTIPDQPLRRVVRPPERDAQGVAFARSRIRRVLRASPAREVLDARPVPLMRHFMASMYEVRGSGVRRFLIAPFAGMFLFATVLLVILLAASGWLITPSYLVWLEWRASRLRLHADGSGVTVANLVRRYKIRWEAVRAIWADEAGYPGPAAVRSNGAGAGSGASPSRPPSDWVGSGVEASRFSLRNSVEAMGTAFRRATAMRSSSL